MWWDPEIAAGQELDRQIAAELKSAAAVVVVWMPTSVESRWVSALGVVSRNTAFNFKGKSVEVAQVARQLKVSHVLESSVRLCRRATELDPDYARAWALMALGQMLLHFAHGRRGDDGMSAAEQALALDANLAREWINRARLIEPDNRSMRYNFACAMTTLRQHDAALEILVPVFETAHIDRPNHAKVDPDLDPIRNDPPFEAMVAGAEARLAAG